MALNNFQGQQTRSSLGRLACIGELYNIRDESLTSEALFKTTLPQQSIKTVDFANTDFTFKFTENFSDKFDLLKVEGELQMGVLLGWITAKGSGEFLTDERKSEKVISCSLMCPIRTKQEKFFASFEEILQHVDLTALQNPKYTHFVSEIAWGANCLLTLEGAFKEEKEKKEIKGILATNLSKLKALSDIKCGGGLDKVNSKILGSLGLHIKVHADVVPEGEWPTSVEKFFEFLLKVPKSLAELNNGKGKPLSYVLTPLEEIRKAAKLVISIDSAIMKKIDEGFVTSTVCLFDDIEEMKRKLNDLHATLTENEKYVKSEVLKTASNMKDTLAIQESNLKTLISENWAQVRSGEMELRDLVRKVEKSKTYDLKLFQYENYLSECSSILKKLATVEMYTSRRVVCLGKEETITDLQLRHPSHEFIVLVTSSKFENSNSELCRNTSCYFVSLVEERKENTIYVVVDLDLTEDKFFLGVSETKCFHLSGSKVVSKDLFANYLEEIESNFARPEDRSNLQLRKHKPGNRVELEIPCPGFKEGTCSSTSLNWLCTVCRDYIEYGFDGNFYCSCGMCPASSFEYRCKEAKHGDRFLTANEEFLGQVLSSLRPVKEMNIVVLGQTGVGKSTWINSIVNYLTYDTMNSAKEHGIICTIPVRYSFHDPVTYEKHEIKLGEKPPEEESDLGMSDTQFAHTYSFLWEGKCVRIVDTPGMGDTRGFKWDQENMKSIIEHLGYLKEIHGLCILIKANDPRFTTYFSYCIKELMVHLPRSVVKNIVFCFTNSRGALYTAGPGSTLLSKLIEELGLQNELSLTPHNTFTLDNEAFVFLSSLSCPNFKYAPKVVKTYADSWEMAADETRRLFDTVSSFQPHHLSETISLVKARERVLTLTIPLAEVGKTIQMNVAKLQKTEAKLRETSLTIQELRENLFVDETFLQMKELPYPRTVCTNKRCVRVLRRNNVNEIEYHTICHDECYLTNVEPKTLNSHGLRGCDAMFNGSCMICGCSWEEHMHLTYSQERTTHKVKNAIVEEKIGKEEEASEIQEKYIQDLKEKTEMNKKEQDFIIHASVKFAMFLKNNAIAVYNDSMGHYLEHLIKEQEKINDRTETDEKILEGMKNTLEQYKYEVEVLQSTINQAKDPEKLTIEDICKLEDDLYNLKINGEMIEQCVKVSRSSTARTQEYRETPIRVCKKSKSTSGGGMIGSMRNAVSKFWSNMTEDKKITQNSIGNMIGEGQAYQRENNILKF